MTEKRLVSLLWVLKNKGKKWSIYELRRGAAAMLGKDDAVYKKNTRFPIVDLALTYGPTFTFVKELEKNGILVKDPKTAEYTVAKAGDVVKLISLARPFSSLKTINFHSPLDFSATLKMIKDSKLAFAFTMFAGSELYRPYVKTDQVHVYIVEGEEEKWGKYLLSKNCLKAHKSQANLFLIPTRQKAFFSEAAKIKRFSIVPAPILLSDLFSFGGLAEEQANFLMEEWLNGRL
ncbi:MAG: hypothetical protein PHD95_01360 [Candidatus ainarchaeum sp.]|nr:hypothetical protein [Candidatus ainarchaeum sp.]